MQVVFTDEKLNKLLLRYENYISLNHFPVFFVNSKLIMLV